MTGLMRWVRRPSKRVVQQVTDEWSPMGIDLALHICTRVVLIVFCFTREREKGL